jgi:dephospho-CoA kinase
MKLLGLTGGIGMGKSTAADLFCKLGVPVIDTDLIARRVVEPGQPALQEIVARFGASMVDDQGHLRRQELARRVFGDAAARRALEEIVHPRIREIWQKQVCDWRTQKPPVSMVVIPLLFETAAADQFAATICVACSAATQRERLAGRPWSAEEIRQRIQAQWPVEKKMELATFVIWTEGTLAVLAEQVRRVVAFASGARP